MLVIENHIEIIGYDGEFMTLCYFYSTTSVTYGGKYNFTNVPRNICFSKSTNNLRKIRIYIYFNQSCV